MRPIHPFFYPALLFLLACGPEEAASEPKNPLEVGAEAVAEAEAPGRSWSELSEVDVAAGLRASVETEGTCCGDAEVPHEGSPARFYLSLAGPSGGGGYLLYLDAEDRTVLLGQEGPGSYSMELFRSSEPATRAEGRVTLHVPPGKLPQGPLRIWAGTQTPSWIGDVALPISGDGGIPSIRLVGPNDLTLPASDVSLAGADGGEPRPEDADRPPPPTGNPDRPPPRGDAASEPPPADAGRPPPEGDTPAADSKKDD